MTPSTVPLLGAPVAERLLAAVRSQVTALPPTGRAPTLASLHLPGARPFMFYARRQAKVAREVGIDFREEVLAEEGRPEELVQRLRQLARDATVDGVLVEHPLPPPFDFQRAIAELPPIKDVDGVSATSLGLLVAGHPIHVPAVARAALAIAHHYEVPLTGARVTVLGRSETVGLPLALLLLGKHAGANATVTVAHSRTPDLKAALAGSTVIFSCVGKPGLLTRAIVPRGATVIDVGLSSVPDPSKPSGARSAGDADAAELEGWVAGLTPVPGGVGPVTVAELMSSVVRAWHAGENPP